MSIKKPTFFACEKCNVVIEEISGGHHAYSSDGTPLTELKANTSDGAKEKHVPVVEQKGSEITVKVGSVLHPMSEEHSIEWVYLETEKGCQRVSLSPDEDPVAVFAVAAGDRPIAAYAYCNLHGFWKTEI